LADVSCCHDYDDVWVCRICGHQLPVAIQNKIRQVCGGTA